jgi:hypothetical protein
MPPVALTWGMFRLKTDYTVTGKRNLPENQFLPEQVLYKTGVRPEESSRRPRHVSHSRSQILGQS